MEVCKTSPPHCGYYRRPASKKEQRSLSLWHFSEVAKWSRRKSSIIKLLQTLFRAESQALLKNHSHSLERERLPGRSCLATCWVDSSFVTLEARLQVKFQASVKSPTAKRCWLQPDGGTQSAVKPNVPHTDHSSDLWQEQLIWCSRGRRCPFDMMWHWQNRKWRLHRAGNVCAETETARRSY